MTTDAPHRTIRPLSLDDVCKQFGGRPVLDGVSLTLRPGAYTCVMGPSGSGKSTLLRILGGHEWPDRGRICFGPDDVTDHPPERRPTHTIFQDLGLFQSLTVLDNVCFSGRLRAEAAGVRRARARELMTLVDLDLERHGGRYPNELSGGERQRVALARALYHPPECLLLDEPMSALDRHLRAGLRNQLRKLRATTGVTFVHVTHDPEEAMFLADDLVVLVDGRVVARGAPTELYRQPPTLDVARLLGTICPLPTEAKAWIRPEHIRLRDDAEGRLRCDELHRAFVAGQWFVTLSVGDVELVARCEAPPSCSASIEWDDEHVLHFTSRP